MNDAVCNRSPPDAWCSNRDLLCRCALASVYAPAMQFDDLPIEPNRDIAIHVATHLGGMQAPLQRDYPRSQASDRAKPKQSIHAGLLLLVVPLVDSIVLDSRYRNN